MYYQDNSITDYNKSCTSMTDLPDESIQCVVTSPPYWGLRKYAGEQDLIWGNVDQCQHEWGDTQTITFNPQRDNNGGLVNNRIDTRGEQKFTKGTTAQVSQGNICSLCGAWRGAYGLEPTVEMYVQHTVEILREIKRVLRKDGVVFWNIGDSYAGSWGNYGGGSRGAGEQRLIVKGSNIQNPVWEGMKDCRPPASYISKSKRINRGPGNRWGGGDNFDPVLKAKDLCLIPFRVALAAQSDGWWVRSVIIWNKPNPMPESVTDRPTDAYEYILMLTRSAKYYWDQEAVREPHSREWWNETVNNTKHECLDRNDGENRQGNGTLAGRNLRNVWTFPTQPYKEAHFATFPEELPERCIKAATPEAGCCSKCGKPWERIVKKGMTAHDGETLGGKEDNSNRIAKLRQAARERGGEYANETKTLGWQPACRCDAPAIPSAVLDPFAGSGTTLWVAKRLGRKAVGYEISSEYCELIIDRNRQQTLQALYSANQ